MIRLDNMKILIMDIVQAGQGPGQEEEKLQEKTEQEPWSKWNCTGSN